MKKNFQRRMTFLLNFLQDRYGQSIRLEQIRSAAQSELDEDLTNNQILYAARELRKTLPDPSRLQVIGEQEIVLRGRQIPSEARDLGHQDIKLAVGHVLWNFLVGKPSAEKTEDSIHYLIPNLAAIVPDCDRRASAHMSKLEAKLDKLRQRYGITLLVDSGSTTRAALRSILSSKSMPFEGVQAPPIGKAVEISQLSRYILPTLITNSPRCLVDVLDSRHANKMEIRILGGVCRGLYGSVAGELANECLSAWGYSNKSIRYDVVVLGTTGVVDDFAGGKAFGVEHLEEATLKSQLMSVAQIRCVVMDSSKLIFDEASCIFAPLSGEHIDFVFLDEGSEDDDLSTRGMPKASQEKVFEFAKFAITCGVVPVIVLHSTSGLIPSIAKKGGRAGQGTHKMKSYSPEHWRYWNTAKEE